MKSAVRILWLWMLSAAMIAGAWASPVAHIEIDERFAPGVAKEGMTHPGTFLFRGIYTQEEPDSSKEVVLFVHGANGSPRDMLDVARHLDSSTQQAWFAYYATGHSVATSGNAIAADLAALMEQHGLTRVAVFAHSMGGLVAWHALAQLGPQVVVTRLVSVNTPWDGNAAARFGVWLSRTPPPIWFDLVPGSKILRQIRSRPVAPPYTLVYTLTRNDAQSTGDGTISLRSQMHPEMKGRASSIVKEIGTHNSALHGDAARRLSLRLLFN